MRMQVFGMCVGAVCNLSAAGLGDRRQVGELRCLELTPLFHHMEHQAHVVQTDALDPRRH